MKKMVKSIACLTAVCSLFSAMSLNISAESLIRRGYSLEAYIDEIGEDGTPPADVAEFIMNSEPKCNLTKSWDVISSEDTKDVYKYIVNYLGEDKDGNRIFSSNQYAKRIGTDDNGDPIINTNAGCAEICCIMGFDETYNDITCGLHDVLVQFDEENKPHIITAKYRGEKGEENPYYTFCCNDGIYETTDLKTGEKMLVRFEFSTSLPYEDYLKWQAGERDINSDRRIPMGDTNGDGEIDIRDITVMNQHVVGLKEIPDYMNIVSDVNADGSVDVKDLGQLKKYIIKLVDKL